MENGPPTVNELVLNILRLISSDIYSEQREWEFSALTPKQQAEERKRAEENRAAWKKRIAEIKAGVRTQIVSKGKQPEWIRSVPAVVML